MNSNLGYVHEHGKSKPRNPPENKNTQSPPAMTSFSYRLSSSIISLSTVSSSKRDCLTRNPNILFREILISYSFLPWLSVHSIYF